MRTIKLHLTVLSILMILIFSCQNKPSGTISEEKSKNLIVLVKFKTQSLKSEAAIVSLTKLIDAVKNEPNFVSITLHIDPNDDTNILLYEEWRDETYYNGEHMKTPHLQNFMDDSRAFLAGPPEITQWKAEKVFR
jgi:quinol monooxygenase YgiN